MKCVNCGSEFGYKGKKKFCSRTCAAKFWVKTNSKSWAKYRNSYYRSHPNFRRHLEEYRKEYSIKTKRKLVEVLGGKCARCGETDYRVLCIHHVLKDRKEDLANISTRLGSARRNVYLKRILLEGKINNYQLLCANCHILHHWEEYHV